MINKILFIIFNLFINNNFVLKIRSNKLKNLNYSFDFLNISFEDFKFLKRIILSKKYYNNKNFEESDLTYHTFNWLHAAKKIGGADIISICRKQIINWKINKYNYNSYIWEMNFISRRLINLIYNFDFYAVSSTIDEKKVFRFLIIKHYFILSLYFKISKNYRSQSIEVTKALLLFSFINNLETKKLLILIDQQIINNLNENGFHKSINPCVHAEFINHLVEIKNMCLFFGINPSKEIEFQIINMSSLLKNLFHKDKTIALFNGSNNANLIAITKINELNKDLKSKELYKINNGLAVYEDQMLKIILDITKPSDKLLNQNLHSGTLSFEMSYNEEKIITNCGSIEKGIGKKPEFLRFSAAHSTIILNNTNISELVEKKSYKRIPKQISYNFDEDDDYLIFISSHDGYKDNFKSIIKRKLMIKKDEHSISGEDDIISTKKNNKKNFYTIRFHLTPICNCLLTNNKKSVLIKTNTKYSWIFKSESKLNLEDSIYISDGKRISKTKQIVISGFASSSKKTEKWSISKVN